MLQPGTLPDLIRMSDTSEYQKVEWLVVEAIFACNSLQKGWFRETTYLNQSGCL